MKTGNSLTLFSQIINFVIFIYFTISLLKINALDIFGLSEKSSCLIVGFLGCSGKSNIKKTFAN